MKSKAVSVGIFAITLVSAAQAAHAAPSYSIEDVTACSSDAMRLCKDKLPDLDAIETCMQSNYENLRPACKARFSRPK